MPSIRHLNENDLATLLWLDHAALTEAALAELVSRVCGRNTQRAAPVVARLRRAGAVIRTVYDPEDRVRRYHLDTLPPLDDALTFPLRVQIARRVEDGTYARVLRSHRARATGLAARVEPVTAPPAPSVVWVAGDAFTNEWGDATRFAVGMRVRARGVLTEDGGPLDPDATEPGQPGLLIARPGNEGTVEFVNGGTFDVQFDRGTYSTIDASEVDVACEVTHLRWHGARERGAQAPAGGQLGPV